MILLHHVLHARSKQHSDVASCAGADTIFGLACTQPTRLTMPCDFCRFVDNQLANKKTRRVLDVAFGEDWSEQYMTQVNEQTEK